MADTGYMICTSPRSGGTLLCTLLRATGVAGWPESHFHGPALGRWARSFGLPEDAPLADIVSAALTRGRAGGPVFGMRQQWPSVPLLLEALASCRAEGTDRARLEGAVGPLRYIHLSRPDKLAQALSLIRAEQTGLWHRNADGSVYEQKEACRADGYDADAITRQITAFEAYDANWRMWFEKEGITPLTLTYDALADDPSGTLAKVLAWIGLDPAHADGVAAPTRKLADDLSTRMAARYVAETGYRHG
ncbi:MAG: Stf0 family sulfotransferase [Pseudomonadota bacterium]